MILIGKEALEELVRRHVDARNAVRMWQRTVRRAAWRTPSDIRAVYPHASFLPNNRVVFNLRGNNYRIDTQVAYQSQIVLIIRAGTHAEYDRWTW